MTELFSEPSIAVAGMVAAASVVLLAFRVWRPALAEFTSSTSSGRFPIWDDADDHLVLENEALQFEVRWLRLAAEPNPSLSKFCGLLTDHGSSPPGSPRRSTRQRQSQAPQVWIVSATNQSLESSAGAGNLNLSPRARQRIRNLGVATLYPEQDFQLDGVEVTSLQAFRCGRGAEEDFILVMSEAPSITGTRQFDEALVSRLCRTLPAPVASTSIVSHEEAALVRDMLELRTLTDEEFNTPLQLLQEFLGRLASLTGFERAALYLVDPDASLAARRFTYGGRSVSRLDAATWSNWEDDYISRRADFAQMTFERIAAAHGFDGAPIGGSVLVTPLASPCEQQGVIVLSSRNSVHLQSADEQLANWAAQFVMQTLDKALARAHFEECAHRDALTELANRRAFDQELSRRLTPFPTADSPCSLLLLDVDRFKSINDTYGHPAGDQVLRTLAELIDQAVRQSRSTDRPLVARYGGEEFVVLLPDVSLAGAGRIAEDVLKAVRRHVSIVGDAVLQLTVSIGIASAPDHGLTAEALVGAADAALYAAKRNGRDQLSIAARTQLQIVERETPASAAGSTPGAARLVSGL